MQYGFSDMRIRTIGREGLVTINSEREIHDVVYNKTARIPYSQLAEEMRETDIFIAGHSESMGLSALEAAMSGSFLVLPVVWGKPFIKPDLVSDLHHEYFEVGDDPARIPWDIVLQALNSGRNRYVWPRIRRGKKLLEGSQKYYTRNFDVFRLEN